MLGRLMWQHAEELLREHVREGRLILLYCGVGAS